MKDHIGIILKGTEESNNPDNEPYISICSSLDFPTMNLFDLIEICNGLKKRRNVDLA